MKNRCTTIRLPFDMQTYGIRVAQNCTNFDVIICTMPGTNRLFIRQNLQGKIRLRRTIITHQSKILVGIIAMQRHTITADIACLNSNGHISTTSILKTRTVFKHLSCLILTEDIGMKIHTFDIVQIIHMAPVH